MSRLVPETFQCTQISFLETKFASSRTESDINNSPQSEKIADDITGINSVQ